MEGECSLKLGSPGALEKVTLSRDLEAREEAIVFEKRIAGYKVSETGLGLVCSRNSRKNVAGWRDRECV